MTRYEKLKLWLRERNASFTWVSRQMGITEVALRYMLKDEAMPRKRHDQAISLGIPEELLPPPRLSRRPRRCREPLLDEKGRIISQCQSSAHTSI